MSKTLYYNSNTHQLVIGDCASNELDTITVEPTLSADTFKISEDGKLQIKINGEYVFVGDKSLVGPAPQLKIDNGCLYVLSDGEWTSLGQIVSDDVAAQFASQKYVRTLPRNYQYLELNTTDDTIIGAINELASFHDLSNNYSTIYSDSTAMINFTKLDLAVESSSQMYKLTGVVKSSIDNGQTNACLVAVPKDSTYNEPSSWKDREYEYHSDIIIAEFGNTFELAEGKSINDYVLYVCFVSSSVIGSLIPKGFGSNTKWELTYHSLFTTYPVTIMVSNLQLIPVEPITTEYLTPEIQDQVNALSEKITQLENELNLANNAAVELTNTIASQAEQIVQLQTDLSQATTRINTLEADTVWLGDLNKEEMLQYWGSKTITEE